MDLTRIKALIDVMAASPIAELELSEPGTRLRLVKGPDAPTAAGSPAPQESPSPAAPPEPVAPLEHIVTSPMPGTVYLSVSPGAPPFVTVGETVEAGRTLALVEAMKTLTPVTADRAGVVARVFVDNATSVQAGDPLFAFAA
ncbi:acetyl-CoA carboxylase biotin carboxyl carrier protein [Methylobacterium nodulans]|uniref:Biotin carboxyl carrier protein of acetyl-CoA carboxylase n=1 Tax=Methylobacterium nodulans (strain LMG 21967 / CNCM I-2342 / ORS 2060) TaxID=460265 RepID=B8IGL9_METNO|nr:biotin/lipoyl-containing protein [Methylobacterium nodulans]ACL55919.1 acetyl-CoA carboxylase, biotin carboxyl carrier protein [Methylobacterium nodulans ORS 2060]